MTALDVPGLVALPPEVHVARFVPFSEFLENRRNGGKPAQVVSDDEPFPRDVSDRFGLPHGTVRTDIRWKEEAGDHLPALQIMRPDGSVTYVPRWATRDDVHRIAHTVKKPKATASGAKAGESSDRLASHVETEARTWQAVDLTPVLNGSYEPLVPTVGKRADGTGVLYAGREHAIYSEPEGGKTWFASSLTQDEMSVGNRVVYIDFEDNESGIVARLLTLGCSPEMIREHFRYLHPATPLGTGIHLDDLRRLLDEHQPTLVVIDGVTEAMTLHGFDPLKNDHAADFGRVLAKQITSHSDAAVVSLDHVTKDREGRGRWAIGAQHKLAGLNGAAFVLTNRTPFGIGLTGRSTIKIAKDRPGQIRKNAVPSGNGLHWYGDLVLESHGEEFADIEIDTPISTGEDSRPVALMDRIVEILTEHGPLSQRKILALAKGNKSRAIEALTLLQVDGVVSDSTPHELLRTSETGPEDD